MFQIYFNTYVSQTVSSTSWIQIFFIDNNNLMWCLTLELYIKIRKKTITMLSIKYKTSKIFNKQTNKTGPM